MKEGTPQRSLRVSMGMRHTLLWEFWGFFLIFFIVAKYAQHKMYHLNHF